MNSTNAPRLLRRAYGNTGIQLSIIGFGGIMLWDNAQEHANRVVAEAVEKGVNYFDVAPTYGDSQDKLGPALEPFRKDVFLACKTTERTREGAAKELQQSLETLRTEYFDLYQLHALTDVADDVDAVFAKGGAMETFIEAKKSGRIRHIGFSAHSVEAACIAMDRYDFDSVLFPVNFVMYRTGNFGPQIMAKAQSKGVARLAIKMLARRRWIEQDCAADREKFPKCWYQPLTDPREMEMALRFTLSQPITASLPPGVESLFRQALDLAMRFAPITDSETKELDALALQLNPLFQAE